MENLEASDKKSIPSGQTSKLAILSFILGLASLLCQLLLFISLLNFDYSFRMDVVLYVQPVLFMAMIPTALLALAIGSIAAVKIRRDPHSKGKGYAVSGIICGGEFVLLAVLVIALWRPLY